MGLAVDCGVSGSGGVVESCVGKDATKEQEERRGVLAFILATSYYHKSRLRLLESSEIQEARSPVSDVLLIPSSTSFRFPGGLLHLRLERKCILYFMG